MGSCNHRAYIPMLIEMVRSGMVDPAQFLTHQRAFSEIIDAYERFDRREPGWIKVD